MSANPMGRPASVWAVVLMYGKEEVTAACLDSLLRQDYGALTSLLVDNASPDGAGERLRQKYPQVRYMQTGENLGYAGGNNRGLATALDAGADYVLILNNDTVLEPSCVSRLVETAEQQPNVGLVCPKILYFDDPSRIAFGGGTYSRLRGAGLHCREGERDTPTEPAVASPVTFACGCALLIPARPARETGGFDEGFFMYCEDVDLGLRLRKAGYTLYYQPAARVHHREPVNASHPSPSQIQLRDRNRRRVVRRHHGRLERMLFAGWFYPMRAVRMTQYLLRGDTERARAILVGATEA